MTCVGLVLTRLDQSKQGLSEPATKINLMLRLCGTLSSMSLVLAGLVQPEQGLLEPTNTDDLTLRLSGTLSCLVLVVTRFVLLIVVVKIFIESCTGVSMYVTCVLYSMRSQA